MAGPGHSYPLSSQGSLPGPVLASQGSLPGSTMTSQGSLPTAAMASPASAGSGPFPPQLGSTGLQQAQPPAPALMSPTKSVNIVSLCKMGQETNHELTQKLLDVFKNLQTMQLPNGVNLSMYQERKLKIEESLRQLQVFKKLRVIYDKVNEESDQEEPPEEVLVPIIGQSIEQGTINTDAYRHVTEEQKQLVEQIRRRNNEIKEIIDKIRIIVWEINTMIVMRKT